MSAPGIAASWLWCGRNTRAGPAWPPRLLVSCGWCRSPRAVHFSQWPRQPAHPPRSGSQICKDLWSLQRDRYYILNITIPFIETILQQKHFILSWDPVKIDFGHLIGGLPRRSGFQWAHWSWPVLPGGLGPEKQGDAGRAGWGVISGESEFKWGEGEVYHEAVRQGLSPLQGWPGVCVHFPPSLDNALPEGRSYRSSFP